MFFSSISFSFSFIICLFLVGEIENALKNLSDDEFEKKYGREKPDSDTHVVFSCQKGRRSQAAMEIARQHGFKKFLETVAIIFC